MQAEFAEAMLYGPLAIVGRNALCRLLSDVLEVGHRVAHVLADFHQVSVQVQQRSYLDGHTPAPRS